MGKMHKITKEAQPRSPQSGSRNLVLLAGQSCKGKNMAGIWGKSTELRRDDHPNIDNIYIYMIMVSGLDFPEPFRS
jgi:hypothetical protein